MLRKKYHFKINLDFVKCFQMLYFVSFDCIIIACSVPLLYMKLYIPPEFNNAMLTLFNK